VDKTELFLKEITEANGVSGYETEVRKIMTRELKPLVDEVKFDKMGSVMGVKKGSALSPRVMVVGHLDEIGFMVKEITSDGYIKFLPLGGWWGHVALGQRMRIITASYIRTETPPPRRSAFLRFSGGTSRAMPTSTTMQTSGSAK
jgi:putative aminopeptidase FrvX